MPSLAPAMNNRQLASQHLWPTNNPKYKWIWRILWKDHQKWAQNGLEIQARFHHVRVDIIVINKNKKACTHRKDSIMSEWISLLWQHIWKHMATHQLYINTIQSSKSSSLLEAYKLSLKYVSVIANYINSVSIDLIQRHFQYTHIFVHD